MTPTAPGSNSRPPSASPPGCATGKASHSTPPAGYLRPSTAATSCGRTGSALYTAGAGRQRAGGRAGRSSERGADYGWPYCYFDLSQQKLVLAPEYGGDGGRRSGRAPASERPSRRFPRTGRLTTSLIYDGQQFPAPYRGGAFIAFHGSWNRAPSPAGRLQRRVPAARRRQTVRELRGLRRWLRRGGQKNRGGPRIGRLGLRSDPTVRSMSRTTSADASGACLPAVPVRRPLPLTKKNKVPVVIGG